MKAMTLNERFESVRRAFPHLVADVPDPAALRYSCGASPSVLGASRVDPTLIHLVPPGMHAVDLLRAAALRTEAPVPRGAEETQSVRVATKRPHEDSYDSAEDDTPSGVVKREVKKEEEHSDPASLTLSAVRVNAIFMVRFPGLPAAVPWLEDPVPVLPRAALRMYLLGLRTIEPDTRRGDDKPRLKYEAPYAAYHGISPFKCKIEMTSSGNDETSRFVLRLTLSLLAASCAGTDGEPAARHVYRHMLAGLDSRCTNRVYTCYLPFHVDLDRYRLANAMYLKVKEHSKRAAAARAAAVGARAGERRPMRDFNNVTIVVPHPTNPKLRLLVMAKGAVIIAGSRNLDENEAALRFLWKTVLPNKRRAPASSLLPYQPEPKRIRLE